MPARSIRYYQTLGLLPRPEVEGRVGHYDRRHEERLGLIRELQQEGLNLQAIGWLLGGSSQVDPRELRQLKRAMLDAWMTTAPEERPAEAVLRMFGDDEVGEDTVQRAEQLRLVERTDDDDVWRVLQPAVLAAGEELARLGLQVPADRALDVLEAMRTSARAVADAFVRIFDQSVLAPWDARGRPAEEWSEVRDAVERMRPLAGEALLGVFQQVMAEAIAERLSDAAPETT